jgi:hypothetical protein
MRRVLMRNPVFSSVGVELKTGTSASPFFFRLYKVAAHTQLCSSGGEPNHLGHLTIAYSNNYEAIIYSVTEFSISASAKH